MRKSSERVNQIFRSLKLLALREVDEPQEDEVILARREAEAFGPGDGHLADDLLAGPLLAADDLPRDHRDVSSLGEEGNWELGKVHLVLAEQPLIGLLPAVDLLARVPVRSHPFPSEKLAPPLPASCCC